MIKKIMVMLAILLFMCTAAYTENKTVKRPNYRGNPNYFNYNGEKGYYIEPTSVPQHKVFKGNWYWGALNAVIYFRERAHHDDSWEMTMRYANPNEDYTVQEKRQKNYGKWICQELNSAGTYYIDDRSFKMWAHPVPKEYLTPDQKKDMKLIYDGYYGIEGETVAVQQAIASDKRAKYLAEKQAKIKKLRKSGKWASIEDKADLVEIINEIAESIPLGYVNTFYYNGDGSVLWLDGEVAFQSVSGIGDLVNEWQGTGGEKDPLSLGLAQK